MSSQITTRISSVTSLILLQISSTVYEQTVLKMILKNGIDKHQRRNYFVQKKIVNCKQFTTVTYNVKYIICSMLSIKFSLKKTLIYSFSTKYLKTCLISHCFDILCYNYMRMFYLLFTSFSRLLFLIVKV